MFRPKSNMPLFVFLLVVIAQAGNSGLSRFFIEKTERQYAPHSFNPLHCRAGTLVGYHDDIKSRILKVIAVTLAGDVVGVDTIMRQIANRMPFAAPQLVDVISQDLSLSFNVVEDVDLVADPLNNPDSHGIGFCSRTSNVEEGANW